MQISANKILTNYVDVFKKTLLYLWKEDIKITNIRTFPQENSKFKINFQLDDGNYIQMRLKIEFDKFNHIQKMGIVYEQNISEEENLFLALSFLYNCPYELEFCNQYGLYTKEDAEKMNNEDSKKIRQIQTERNLLYNNQFYIFNMDRIEDGCRDKNLENILNSIHKLCMEFN